MNAVLQEIGATGKTTLLVFNKLDRLENGIVPDQFLAQFPQAVGISAATGEGIPALLSELGALLRPKRDFVELSVPHKDAAVISRLYAFGQVVEQDYDGDSARFKARIPPHLHREFERFIVDAGDGARGQVGGAAVK